MRFSQVILTAGLAALACSTMACNSLLGIDDVSRASPDAMPRIPPDGAAMCDVVSDISLVNASATTSTLTHGQFGPNIAIQLNVDPKPDSLDILLDNNQAGHGTLTAVGTYPLTPGDAKLETCGICVVIFTNYDSSAKTFSQDYLANAQGALTVTRSDATGLAGRIRTLSFRHVDLSGPTQDINDGCKATIEDIEFDLAYSATAAPSVEAATHRALATHRTR